ncbi:MAG: putative serine/threonine kinase, partial [Thermoleophilia bacterium]|nr:putative serine/threonine kinase [Thermoleophilia bacterium]
MTTARTQSGDSFGMRYRVLRPIGEGGMARVVEADDELLKRRVAVKVLHDQFAVDADATERFWREARAAASLN